MKYTYLFFAFITHAALYCVKMTEIEGYQPNMGAFYVVYVIALLYTLSLIYIAYGHKIGYWAISMLCMFTGAIWATKLNDMPIATSAIMLACLLGVYGCHLMIAKPIQKTVDLSPLADAMEKKDYWKHQDEKDKPTEADCWDGDESDKFLQ